MNESESIRKLGMTTPELVKWAYPSIFNGHGFDRLYHLDVANALYVVCLDKRYRPVSIPVPIHLGSRGGILIHPRDILKVPLRWSCDKIIVIMSATTGEDKTSKTAYIFGGESGMKNESETIARMRLAADTVGIKLLDWIHIRNDGVWYDWNRNGNMTGVSRPRVSADDDTSIDLWDDPGTTDMSNEKSGRHTLERKWGFGISESTSSYRSKTEDLTYERLVKSGQKSKAMTLLRKHAGKMMPDTIVTDDDGLPEVVCHGGTFTLNGKFVPETGSEGMHFGTYDAAAERLNYSLVGELEKGDDGLWHWWYDDGTEDGKPTKTATEKRVQMNSKNGTGEILGYFLNITKVSGVTKDAAYDWDVEVKRAKSSGMDGLKYKNAYEDFGSISYVAFRPEQVKLADITYDDSGKPIPLSKRFDTTNPDVRY